MQVQTLKTLCEYGKEYLDVVERASYEYASKVGERIMQSLQQLDDAMLCDQMSRLEHSLQTATRAWYDGADLDWIVSALVHNIGHVHAPFDNDEYASLVLRPFVREQCSWTVKTQMEFEKYHYAAQIGQDPDERERYRGTLYFDDGIKFCDRWNILSVDPSYSSLPLEFFRPFVENVFSRSPYDITVTRPRSRVALFDACVAQSRKVAA
jgi:predicted HD phosphohydrolase